MALGRTNCFIMKADGSGGSGVTTVDLPTHPASIAYNAKNQNVDIALTYSSTDFVSGVRVAFKTGAYPENPDDGEFVEVEGAAETVNVPNLANGATYYFRVFLYREVSGVKYFQSDITNARASCIPRAVEISGITPMVEAADHIVITESGTFTLTANAGTKIIIGSAGAGQNGGFVAEHTISADVVNETCTLTVSAARKANSSKLVVGSNSYDCGATEQIVQSKWGPIGGKGGGPVNTTYGSIGDNVTGAGGGRGGVWWPSVSDSGSYYRGGVGGNHGNYGNYGGCGYNWDNNKGAATDGKCGKAGASTEKSCNYSDMTLGNGGGGGYASGGGAGARSKCESDYYDGGSTGTAGTGIMIIQWD